MKTDKYEKFKLPCDDSFDKFFKLVKEYLELKGYPGFTVKKLQSIGALMPAKTMYNEVSSPKRVGDMVIRGLKKIA